MSSNIGIQKHWFENSSRKNLIRFHIVYFLKIWMKSENCKKINSLTLCGLNFSFEKLLKKEIENTNFYCCENNIKIFNSINCDNKIGTLYNISLNNFWYIQKPDIKINFIWADYCGLPTSSLIDDILNQLKNCDDKCLYFVTFNLQPRQRGGAQKWLSDNMMFQKTDLKTSLNFEIDEKIIKNEELNIFKFYDTIYNSSNTNYVKMNTIGFSKNSTNFNQLFTSERINKLCVEFRHFSQGKVFQIFQ